MKHIEKDPLQAGIEITNWLLLLLLFVLAVLFFSWRVAVSILVGGFISIVNFHWLYHDLFKMFGKVNSTGSLPRAGSAILGFFIRFGVTAIILYLLFIAEAFNIPGLVVGLSVVVLNLLLTAVWLFFKKKRFEEA